MIGELDHLLRTAFDVTPLSPLTGLYALLGVVVSLVVWRPLVRATSWASVPTLLALLALTLVLALTLAPAATDITSDSSGCYLGGRHLRSRLLQIRTDPESLLNLVLFVPLGLFAVLALRRIWLPTLLVLVLPAVIELAQLRIPGRECSGIDYLTNAAGGLAGVLLGALTLWLLRRRGLPAG
jgi:VanZ family protein